MPPKIQWKIRGEVSSIAQFKFLGHLEQDASVLDTSFHFLADTFPGLSPTIALIFLY
jgi:hypothetical protein